MVGDPTVDGAAAAVRLAGKAETDDATVGHRPAATGSHHRSARIPAAFGRVVGPSRAPPVIGLEPE
jgi:hypothetical protein